jgi:hypothetical protein
MAPKTVYEERKEKEQNSPLLLLESVDKASLATIKIDYQRPDGSWSKVALPSCDFSSCELTVYCHGEFREAAREYGWIGEQRFRNYCRTLLGNARQTWDRAVEAGPNNFQEATFNRALSRVLSEMAGIGAYDHLLEYLAVAKKPYTMTSCELSTRLSTIVEFAPYFLRADNTNGPEILPLQHRTWLVRMHPEAWVRNFVNAGKSAANQTIPQIVEYMTTQNSLEPRTNKSTTPKKRDNDGSDRNDRNHGGRGQGRGFNTGG